jgi:DNA-binding transcriptional MerR regulator
MANTIQQLDLFGMPIQAAVSPKAKKQKQAQALKESVVTNSSPDPVVYASDQIVVKIKPKGIVEAIVEASNTKTAGKRGRKSFKEIDASVDLIEVPEDSELEKKLYYSISEVAAWFKVNTSLLRYWENEFDVLQPRKTRKGDRLFRVEDIKNLKLIYFLLRQRKFSIEGAKSYLKNHKQKIDTETQLVKALSGFRGFLLELKSSLEGRG